MAEGLPHCSAQMDSTTLEILSKQNPFNPPFPTLQVHLTFNSSPPVLFPCPLACLPYIFTESLPSLSLISQLNFHFLNSTISPCHAFPDVTVSSWHYYILPSLLQISVYCSNTKYTPNVHPFSEQRSLFRDRDAVM